MSWTESRKARHKTNGFRRDDAGNARHPGLLPIPRPTSHSGVPPLMSTDPETIDPETEAASLIETCAAALEAAEELAGQARAALADHVTNNGRIERAAMEEHQFACHGLAWIATYVETL